MTNKTLLPPGTETCGCCEGVAASTPLGLDNRIGLSAIAYRIGDYAQFKRSLLAGLSSSKVPELAGLRTRDDARSAQCRDHAVRGSSLRTA